MPHVTPMPNQDISGAVQDLFQGLEKKLGMVPNMYRTMGHIPELLAAELQMSQAIQRELPPKFRELAYLRTSLLNGCGY